MDAEPHPQHQHPAILPHHLARECLPGGGFPRPQLSREGKEQIHSSASGSASSVRSDEPPRPALDRLSPDVPRRAALARLVGQVERVYGVVDQLVRENKLLEAKVQQLREMQQRAKL